MTATQTIQSPAAKKQTAANNPVLARIKKVANDKNYKIIVCQAGDSGEGWASWLAAKQLFDYSAQEAWAIYFRTGKIGDGSISAETAAAWGIAQ